jgi:sugar/nucleoside kinase (ribokinase family)
VSNTAAADAIDLLVVGHVTEDLLDGRGALGGAATYAALTARNLGARVGVLTSAGWEPDLVDVLKGIHVARVSAEVTTYFRNRYTNAHREQVIVALAEPLRPEHVLPPWRAAPVVLLAPVAREVDPSLAAVFPDALLAVSPQGWMRAWDRKGRVRQVPWQLAEQVLPLVSACVVSEPDVPDRKLLERYAGLARLLVVTLAEKGARVYQAGRLLYHSPSFKPKQVVDPTGAGDVFAAAFVLKLRETGDPSASADYANCVASFAVERMGPEAIPSAEQVDARWRAGQRLPL